MSGIFVALLFLALFCLEIFLGSLSLWAFQELVNSKPMALMKIHYQKSLRLILPMAGLFLILCFGLHHIFPWAETQGAKGFRGFYLQPMSFLVRNAVYFLIWAYWSYRILKEKKIKSALVLILAGLTATFAAIDWILSLDPLYRSSAFGLIFFMSSSLLAYAFHLRRVSSSADSKTLIQLNNIHLAFIGSWAYVAFMEFLIVWFGNAPAEVSWFAPRALTSWKFLAVTVILLQFSLPVFLLFFRALKKSVVFTRSLALLTVFMQIIYLLWLVLPSFYRGGFQIPILTGFALVLSAASPFLLPRWLK